MAVFILSPWLVVLGYDVLYYLYRSFMFELPLIGGRAKGRDDNVEVLDRSVPSAVPVPIPVSRRSRSRNEDSSSFSSPPPSLRSDETLLSPPSPSYSSSFSPVVGFTQRQSGRGHNLSGSTLGPAGSKPESSSTSTPRSKSTSGTDEPGCEAATEKQMQNHSQKEPKQQQQKEQRQQRKDQEMTGEEDEQMWEGPPPPKPAALPRLESGPDPTMAPHPPLLPHFLSFSNPPSPAGRGPVSIHSPTVTTTAAATAATATAMTTQTAGVPAQRRPHRNHVSDDAPS